MYAKLICQYFFAIAKIWAHNSFTSLQQDSFFSFTQLPVSTKMFIFIRLGIDIRHAKMDAFFLLSIVFAVSAVGFVVRNNFYPWCRRHRLEIFEIQSCKWSERHSDLNHGTNDVQMMVYLSVGSFGSIRWNFRRLPPRFLRRSSGFDDDVDCELGNDSMAQLFFLLFINDSGIWHWFSWNSGRNKWGKKERVRVVYMLFFSVFFFK